MSGGAFPCSARLVQVSPELWQTACPEDGLSLGYLAGELAASARKMAKGQSLRDLRLHLLAIAQRVDRWLARPPRPWDSSWPVPPELLPAWSELLEALAGQRAATAAATLGKRHVLPFLPLLFVPAAGDVPGAGAYGRLDVQGHVAELEPYAGVLEPEPQAGEARPEAAAGGAIVMAARARLDQFGLAAQQGNGVVEQVRFWPPYLGEAGDG